MRYCICVLFSFLLLRAYADGIPAWKWHGGLYAGLNTSVLNISSDRAGSITTGSQWSAGFGMYFKTNMKNMFRIECQLAYETTGSPRELYYLYQQDVYYRIYDRYRTIPLTIMLIRNIGWKETFSLGVGFKSSFCVNHKVKHDTDPPGPGIIYSPDVLGWFGSPVVQTSLNLPYADISLQAWYAVTPLIADAGVKVFPMGVALQVKTRIIGSHAE